MSGPSKTPWKVVPGTTSGCAIIAELEPKVRRNVASVGGQVRDANARRIVAAVNGTSTLTVEALEAGVVDKLVEAAVAVLHDWHSETGFVESVRLTTGRPWPWYHGEKSVADLRAALALARGEQA